MCVCVRARLHFTHFGSVSMIVARASLTAVHIFMDRVVPDGAAAGATVVIVRCQAGWARPRERARRAKSICFFVFCFATRRGTVCHCACVLCEEGGIEHADSSGRGPGVAHTAPPRECGARPLVAKEE